LYKEGSKRSGIPGKMRNFVHDELSPKKEKKEMIAKTTTMFQNRYIEGVQEKCAAEGPDSTSQRTTEQNVLGTVPPASYKKASSIIFSIRHTIILVIHSVGTS